MKPFRYTIFCAAALIGLSAPYAYAHYENGVFYHGSGHKKHEHVLSGQQKLELHRYLNYEEREPCQNYREVPTGFYREACDLKYHHPKKVKEIRQVQVRRETQQSRVLSSYEINFAFDSAVIEPSEEEVVDRISREIKTYKPREVIIAGHADKAGSDDYNIALSQRRAQAVSDSLTELGIPNRVLDEVAHGEDHPAVETKDGVPLRENRRVVIEFRK